MACASVGNKIYLFGGYNGGNKNTIYEFDTGTETITTLAETLPIATREMCCAADGNIIYLFGGASADVLNTTNRFSITHELTQGDTEIKSGSHKNKFNLINTDTVQVQIGVESVYVGNENNKAALAEAYLHNGTQWKQI